MISAQYWANLIKGTTGTIKVLIGLCGCEGSWPASQYYNSSREYLRKQVTKFAPHMLDREKSRIDIVLIETDYHSYISIISNIEGIY